MGQVTGRGYGEPRGRLGRLIERRRQAAGLTQQQLAERSGVSVGVIRDLEQGRTARPRPGSADSLAAALGLSDGELAAVTEDGSAGQRHPASEAARRQAAAPNQQIRLTVLGPLSVSRDGVPVATGGQRSRAVLALLGVQPGRPVSREAIVDAVWGAAPPPSAVNMVQSCVSRLRRVLATGDPGSGGVLVSAADGGYLLKVTAGQLDLLEFRDLGSRARVAAAAGDHAGACGLFERAVGLWRGDPVADVVVLQGHPALAGLARERAALLVDYADAAAVGGWHERVVEHLRVLAEAEPLDERVHARLMIALAATGQQAAALSVFGQLSERLSDELGVRPGAEFTDAHLRVVRGGPFSGGRAVQAGRQPGSEPQREQGGSTVAAAAAGAGAMPEAAPPRQLPVGVAQFTGRAGELAVLTGLLERAGGDAGTVVISAIGGMAGIGKTALAVHWAHRAADRFPDGQLYVNLRGFDPSGTPAAPGEVIRGFLDALGVGAGQVPPSLDAQAGLYRSLLAGKRMLIVLDNAASEQQIRPLLPGSPGSLVLVTSRSQLAGLAASQGARLLSLDVLTDTEARQLLIARVGDTRAGAEPGAVSQIISLCARLPLALAVAAARAAARPHLPLAVLAAELRGTQSRLEALDTGDPTVSVRAVFSWSYAQLPPPAARMFRLLGLHPGPDISVPAAASLAGIPPGQGRRQLAELARAHLVTEHSAGRYAMHDLLRAYASEQARAAETSADCQLALHRVLDHYLHTARAAALLFNPGHDPITLDSPRTGVAPEELAGHQQAREWFENEYRVLLAAVAMAMAQVGDFGVYAWQLSWAMSRFFDWRGHWHDWAAIQGTALAAAARLEDRAGQVISRRLLASAQARLGDYSAARAGMEKSLEEYQKLGDRGGQARAHQSLCWLAHLQGLHADALRHAHQSMVLRRDVGDRHGHAASLNSVGWSHALLGNYQQARRFCRQALALHQRYGNPEGEANTWDSLGYAERKLGNLTEAIACHQRALALFRELGDRLNEADSLSDLGDTWHGAGQLSQAGVAWRQALTILDDLQHPEAERLRVKLAAAQDRPASQSPES